MILERAGDLVIPTVLCIKPSMWVGMMQRKDYKPCNECGLHGGGQSLTQLL